MGADLYPLGLFAHSFSGVAVPHQESREKISKDYREKEEEEVIVHSVKEDKITGNGPIVQSSHHHHHHHHSESSIKLAKEIGTDYSYKREVVWFNAIGFLALHILAVYGVYLMFSGRAKIWTTIYGEDELPYYISNRNKRLCSLSFTSLLVSLRIWPGHYNGRPSTLGPSIVQGE